MKSALVKVLAILLAALLPVCGASCEGQDGDLYICRLLDNGSVMITGYRGTEADLVFPETIGGRTVTGLSGSFCMNSPATAARAPPASQACASRTLGALRTPCRSMRTDSTTLRLWNRCSRAQGRTPQTSSAACPNTTPPRPNPVSTDEKSPISGLPSIRSGGAEPKTPCLAFASIRLSG